MKTKKPTKSVVKEKDYTASIKVLGKIYKSTGSTIIETLNNLKVESKIVGVVILSIQKGEIKKDKILFINQATRLFSPSKLTREVAIKQTSLMFQGI